jgi:hypothetical protein
MCGKRLLCLLLPDRPVDATAQSGFFYGPLFDVTTIVDHHQNNFYGNR